MLRRYVPTNWDANELGHGSLSQKSVPKNAAHQLRVETHNRQMYAWTFRLKDFIFQFQWLYGSEQKICLLTKTPYCMTTASRSCCCKYRSAIALTYVHLKHLQFFLRNGIKTSRSNTPAVKGHRHTIDIHMNSRTKVAKFDPEFVG